MVLVAGLPLRQKAMRGRCRRRHRSSCIGVVVTEVACAEAVAIRGPQHQLSKGTTGGQKVKDDPKVAKLRRKIERGRDCCESASILASIARNDAVLQPQLTQLELADSTSSSCQPSGLCERPLALNGVTPAVLTPKRGREIGVCISPRVGSSIMGITESKETQQARAARFEGSPTKASQWLWHDSARSSPRGRAAGQMSLSTSVVGTCTILEKEYARVPAGMVPDPATIRPKTVLRNALKMVLQRWAARPAERGLPPPPGTTAGSDDWSITYAWVTSQLRSIRQDLTVQNLRGKTARRCYSAAVRCALDASDWAEFSPSLSRLFELYKEEGDTPPAEFHAYRMLKLISDALRSGASSSTALIEQLRSLVLPAATSVAMQLPASRLGNHQTSGSSLLVAPEMAHAHALLAAIAGGELKRALSLAQTGCVEQHGHAAGLVREHIATPLRRMLDATITKAVRSQAAPTRLVSAAAVKRTQLPENAAVPTEKAAEPARKRTKAANYSKKSSKGHKYSTN